MFLFIIQDMKKRKILFLLICSTVLFVIISRCSDGKRMIELTFKLNNTEGFNSSDQMVVWLENSDSTFVKTLFVSEYMAYGGYNLDYICPDWPERAGWEMISNDEFDAVTGATPDPGDVKFEFIVEKDSIPAGEYKLFIEVHLAEKYNELYGTTINLSDTTSIRELNVTFIPAKYPKATGNHLSDVKVIYK